MTPELIAIFGVGIALAAAIFAQARHNNRMIHKRFDAMEDKFTAIEAKISELENQISQLRERMAHLEGLLEGLRESIVGRAAA